MLLIPILVIGSLALAILNLPIEGYRDALDAIGGGTLSTILLYIYDSTCGFMSAYIVLSISYYYSYTFDSKNFALRVLAMVNAFVCFVASFGSVSGSLELTHFGMLGVFTAIICGLLATKLFYTLCNLTMKHLRVQTVASDVHYRSSLAAVIPLTICIIAFIGLNLLINAVFHVSNFNELISMLFVMLFSNMQGDLASGVLYTFMQNFLWFFGIHGGNVLDPVAQEVFVESGNIVNKSFMDSFAVMGGSGATVCLLVAMIIFARARNNRQLAYSSIPTIIFNINEPIVYGLPIVLNPLMLIPFTMVPVLSLILAYAAATTGFIPSELNEVNWTTPPLLSGYVITGSYSGVVIQAIIIAVGTAVYAPFVRLSERMQKSKERLLMDKMSDEYFEACKAGTHVNLLGRQDDIGTLAKIMVEQLKQDVVREKITMLYQPQIHYKDGIIGAEALLRWNYMDKPVAPPLIIQLAEENDYYNKLTECILRKTCLEIKRIREHTTRTIKVSVNVTVEQLNNRAFIDHVIGLVKENGITGNLMLETTEETSIIFFDRISEHIDLLHQNGVSIAIDDFSMGQTSLKYLQSNHFDLVKLDGSLVLRITDNQRSRDIVHSIIKLGHRLGFAIIGEYVENEAIRDTLHELGCNLYQGFFYSKAISPEAFIEYYREHQPGFEEKREIEGGKEQ